MIHKFNWGISCNGRINGCSDFLIITIVPQTIIPPEPPDLGGVGGSLNNTQNVQNNEMMSKTNSISFRDKVLGT